jgi:hypothetical protein
MNRACAKKTVRKISRIPYRVLDAPSLQVNYLLFFSLFFVCFLFTVFAFLFFVKENDESVGTLCGVKRSVSQVL